MFLQDELDPCCLLLLCLIQEHMLSLHAPAHALLLHAQHYQLNTILFHLLLHSSDELKWIPLQNLHLNHLQCHRKHHLPPQGYQLYHLHHYPTIFHNEDISRLMYSFQHLLHSAIYLYLMKYNIHHHSKLP